MLIEKFKIFLLNTLMFFSSDLYIFKYVKWDEIEVKNTENGELLTFYEKTSHLAIFNPFM